MGYLASDFKDVDQSDDIAKYSNCLNLLYSIEFFKKYKAESHKMLNLNEGLNVLDVGCGLGDDLIELAREVGPTGRVAGVDSSAALLKIAETNLENGLKNIRLFTGDALDLPFEDESFDRCRINRTLQHISEPKKALMEIYRVLKPGGRMLAFDNDWETFTYSGMNRELVRKVANYWCDSFPSGWVGRYLYGYFREIGLTDVKVYPRTLVIKNLEKSDQVFDLFQTIQLVVREKIIAQNEADALLSEMKEQDRAGRFFSSYTGFIVFGIKQS